MGIRRLAALVVVLVAAAIPGAPDRHAPHAQAGPVDLNLLIAVDSSYSVDNVEYELQRKGISAALRDPVVQTAIADGAYGAIGVVIMQWSSSRSQLIGVSWHRVSDPVSAEAFAQAAAVMPRRMADGTTSISTALLRGADILNDSPFLGSRMVIDIQGDGTNNDGPEPEDVRDQVISAGITINGLTINTQLKWLHEYYADKVIGGPGAFVEVTANFKGYAEAMRRKLLREIRPPIVSQNASRRRGA